MLNTILMYATAHPISAAGLAVLAIVLLGFIWSWRPRFKKVHPVQTLKLRLTPTVVLRARHMYLMVAKYFTPADKKACQVVEAELRRRGKLA